MKRHQIAEWYGEPFVQMPPARRRELAKTALENSEIPMCPFQKGHHACGKKGGVCSLQAPDSTPVITCPNRFAEDNLIPNWLAQIVNFNDAYLAREVPFMRSPSTNRPAGRIDLVVARDKKASSWLGLEMQAVYFSGEGMQARRLLMEIFEIQSRLEKEHVQDAIDRCKSLKSTYERLLTSLKRNET